MQTVRYAHNAQQALGRAAEEYCAHVDNGNHGQQTIADDFLSIKL